MRIAIEGCAHGELEKIYATIAALEAASGDPGDKVDLLLCCGDFQATRNTGDLNCMAVPRKFQDMCSFYKYYSGEQIAPILTVFIGGNHEASNYMQELPYGGWVAPNIYYLGYAGVVCVNGVRIAGLSGIYKGYNYHKGHFEMSPFDENTKKSAYHVRQLDVFRLQQLSGRVDVCMSHDWPRGVTNFGNSEQLCRFKPHFADEIAENRLGSPPAEELLHRLRPIHWFSGHLHCKFAAIVPHRGAATSTKFLALDKCLPRRRFLQLLDIATTTKSEADDAEKQNVVLEYDLEWLTILHCTNHLLSVKPTTHYMPGPGGTERHDYTPTADERDLVLQKMHGDLKIPLNFQRTAAPHDNQSRSSGQQQPNAQLNQQTTKLCEQLGLDDPVSLLMVMQGMPLNHSTYYDDRQIPDAEVAAVEAKTTELDAVTRERTAFTLPAPQLDNPDSLALDEEDDDKQQLEKEIQLGSKDTEMEANSTLDTDIAVSEVEIPSQFESDNKDEIKCDDGIPAKKFKRRNEAIYAAPVEE